MTQSEANSTNEKHLLDTVLNNLKIFRKPKFKVGDNVRISKYNHVFEKGYTQNWTTEIFKSTRLRNTKEIHDINSGFYEYELMYENKQ